jgi:hypothetical protein
MLGFTGLHVQVLMYRSISLADGVPLELSDGTKIPKSVRMEMFEQLKTVSEPVCVHVCLCLCLWVCVCVREFMSVLVPLYLCVRAYIHLYNAGL